jgi:hypothetical protein
MFDLNGKAGRGRELPGPCGTDSKFKLGNARVWIAEHQARRREMEGADAVEGDGGNGMGHGPILS